MKTAFYIIISLLLAGTTCIAQVKKNMPKGDHTNAMRLQYTGGKYDVFIVDYPAKNIQLYWKDDKGNILKNMAKLKAFTDRTGKKLIFAANAGMYTTENAPKGLYIENGKEIRHIDLRTGPKTNFYMQPNGVFYTTAKHAYIVTSPTFDKKKEKVINATQSGPMLVINGEINTQFTKGSQNVNIRNGVGIDRDGRVFFVISNGLVNLYDFASLFKDKLHCDQALFFDGGISKTYLPKLNRTDSEGDLGPLIGVTE